MKFSTLFLPLLFLTASAFAQEPNQQTVRQAIVGCSVTRTYGWNQSRSYDDFAWGDSGAYSNGQHFIGNFGLPCPYMQSSEYSVQPIYGDVIEMNRDDAYNY